MDAERLEVARFPAGAVDQLKALGLMSEIITWRLRLFIPTTADGVVILGTLLDRHPVLQCTARARARACAGEGAMIEPQAAVLARHLAAHAAGVCRHYLSTRNPP